MVTNIYFCLEIAYTTLNKIFEHKNYQHLLNTFQILDVQEVYSYNEQNLDLQNQQMLNNAIYFVLKFFLLPKLNH